MKKLLLFSVVFFIFSVLTLSAQWFDGGLSLLNTTGFTRDGETAFTQRDKASLWMEAGLSKSFKTAFQGSYTFDLERYYLFDVDLLKVEGNFVKYGDTPFRITVEAGRFLFSDFTGKVLAHNLDGIRLETGLPFMTLLVSAGYSGLNAKPNSSIIMSKKDLSDSGEDTLYFSPHRIVEIVSFRFPELFARQHLTVSAILQQDLRPAGELIAEGDTTYSETGGGRLNTGYFGLGFKGPLVSGLYYKLYGYFGTGKSLSYISGAYSYETISSFMAGTELSYFMPKVLQSRISVKFLATSGEPDGDVYYEDNQAGLATTFVPISRPGVGLVFSPQLGNIAYGEFSYSFKPLSNIKHVFGDNFQIQLKGLPVFRTTAGPISESGLDEASTAKYLGTEVDGFINMRFLSDLGLSVSTGFFFPGAAAFTDTTTRMVGKMALSLSM